MKTRSTPLTSASDVRTEDVERAMDPIRGRTALDSAGTRDPEKDPADYQSPVPPAELDHDFTHEVDSIIPPIDGYDQVATKEPKQPMEEIMEESYEDHTSEELKAMLKARGFTDDQIPSTKKERVEALREDDRVG